MTSNTVTEKENNLSEGRQYPTAHSFMGAAVTFMPIAGAVTYGVNTLVDKLPHNTLSDTQQLVGGLLAIAFAHGSLGKAFDAFSDYATGTESRAFLGRNTVAALAISGAMSAVIIPQHLSQKAEQFNDMQRSAAMECYRENAPKGTEVIRHRYADGFYTYECPTPNAALGPRAMPTGPVRR